MECVKKLGDASKKNVSTEVSSSGTFLLTAAHVAFGNLYGNDNENVVHEYCVKTLNDCSASSGYVHTNQLSLDYALLRCKLEFDIEVFRTNYFNIPQFNATFSALGMCDAEELLSCWSNMIAGNFQVQVIKRGVTTGETRGSYNCISDKNVILINREEGAQNYYSRPGDSGALVCAEYDERIVLWNSFHWE